MTTVRILVGDVRERLAEIPDATVQTVVTSPPYFGLRDYGMAAQLGLEPTPAGFIAELVGVFREVRRTLRADGTAWVNMGDSYANPGHAKGNPGSGRSSYARGEAESGFRHAKAWPGARNKSLIGIPWRLAFGLQDDGWTLRQDIVWAKPNPMPESVRDRCTKSHEYVFLLSKGPRYWFDADAIAEPVAAATVARLSQDVAAQAGSDRVPGKSNGPMKAVGRRRGDPVGGSRGTQRSPGGVYDGAETRNRRSVWTVATTPFKGAHFATYPLALVEPCVRAGSMVGGLVLDPFGGSGTTGVVAACEGRDAVLCELNPAYARLAVERLDAQCPAGTRIVLDLGGGVEEVRLAAGPPAPKRKRAKPAPAPEPADPRQVELFAEAA